MLCFVKKICSLVMVFVILFCLCACSESERAEPEPEVSSVAKEVIEPFFESDEQINDFILCFNEISSDPFEKSEVERGNVRNKAIISKDDVYIEIHGVKADKNIDTPAYVIISASGKDEDALFSLFSDCLKAFDSSLSDGEINKAWDDIQNGHYSIDYSFKDEPLSPVYKLGKLQLAFGVTLYGDSIMIDILCEK